jgi:hypothetical protein
LIKEEAEESEEDTLKGPLGTAREAQGLLFDQLNFEGCYTRHLSFKLTHTEEERVAMSNNEKELFPQRVPIILERSSEEKGYA